MGHSRRARLTRRRLRSPAARARARRIAALQSWLRRRLALIGVVLVMLAPFGVMPTLTNLRIAFGTAPPDVVASGSGITSYTENTPPDFSANNAAIIDSGATVDTSGVGPGPYDFNTDQVKALFAGANPGTGQLLLVNTANIQITGTQVIYVPTMTQIGSYNGPVICCGVLAIPLASGSAIDVPMIDAVLQAIAYRDVNENPSGSGGNLQLLVTDASGAVTGGPANYTITSEIAVNDPPTISAPAGPLSMHDDADLPINSPQITLHDVEAEGAGCAGCTLQFELKVTQGTLKMTAGGCSVTSQDIILDLPPGQTNTCLATLVYHSPSSYTGPDTLTIDVSDKGRSPAPAATASGSVTINITAVNDPPIITAPGLVNVTEDTSTTIGSGGVFSVADSDAGTDPILLTLSLTGGTPGTIGLGSTTNLTLVSGANNSTTFGYTGAQSDWNAALMSLTYTTVPNSSVSDNLHIVADDQGHNGPSMGAAPVPTDTTITISTVNDPPVTTPPASLNVTEDTPATIGSGGVFSVVDPDAGSAPILLTLSLTGGTPGTISLGSTTNLTLVSGANNSTTFGYTGAQSDWNAALMTLTYTTVPNATTADNLHIVPNDQGNTGSIAGSAPVNTDTTITITAVNDAPVVSVPAGQPIFVNEDSPLNFSGGNLVAINDADIGGSPYHVTLSVSNGTLTLASTTGLSFNAGDGTSDPSMDFTGTQTSVNNALNGMTYQGNLNYMGPDTLTITANDQGASGSGPPSGLNDTEIVTITVGGVNDPPVITAPAGTLTPDEDTDFAISGVSIADPDANPDPIQVTLTVTQGVVSLKPAAIGSLSFSTGDGTQDAAMTFTGTLTNVDDALSGLVFHASPANYNGAASIQIGADDLGHNGSGPHGTDSKTITLMVGAVDDAPTITKMSPTYTINEDTALQISGMAITINDVDAGSFDVQITLSVNHGTLTRDPGAAVSSESGNGTGTLTITASLTNVNDAIDPLTYQPGANFNGSDTLSIFVSDLGHSGSGGPLTATDAIGITVQPVNDAPVVTVPGAQSIPEDTSRGIGGVAVADLDAGSNPIKVSLSVSSGTLTLNSRTGLAFSVGDGVSDPTMTFTGPQATINTALGSLIYRGNQDYNGPDTLVVSVDDQGNQGAGGALTDTKNVAITVISENDGPAISLPAAQAVGEDTDLVIDTVGITINDADVGGGQVEVQLTVANGRLTLSTTAGLAFSVGDGSGDPTMTFRGTLTQVNAALHHLIYHGNPNFNGSDPLMIVAGDLGNTGNGGPMTDNKVLPISVGSVNDPPVVTVPGAQTVQEDTDKQIAGISVADPDAGSSPLRMTLSASHGTITLATTAGLTFLAGDGTADPTITFTASQNAANAALAGLIYRGQQDYNGPDTLAVSVNDQGASGVGGPLADSKSVAITVTSVNDAPVLTLPGPTPRANSAAAVAIDDQATVTDVDSPDFDGGMLMVDVSDNAASSDRLDIRNQGTGAGQIGHSGSTVTYGGMPIGTYSGEVSASTPLVVTFNANATAAAIQALVRNVTFRLADAEPNAGSRSIRFVLSDGDGGSTGPVAKALRAAPLADVSLALGDIPAAVQLSSPVAFSLTLTNKGPLTATGIVITDVLPVELTFRGSEASQGSCTTSGQQVTCQIGSLAVGKQITLVIRTTAEISQNITNVIEVTTSSDDPNPADNRVVSKIWIIGPNPPGDDKPAETERPAKLTQEARQQRERTNRSNLDDYRTEGNVVEVNLMADVPYAVVAMRDGLERIALPCKDGCPTVQVGDYLEADGVKENEALFIAESVTLTRGGKKVH
jgi:hypothetical protein